LLLWKVAWLELVTDSSGQTISHQLPTQAMKHTIRANASTTSHQNSEVLHHDKNSPFMAPLVPTELQNLKISHTYNHLYLHQKCYYRRHRQSRKTNGPIRYGWVWSRYMAMAL
jgi:hypothetical protein